MRVYLHRLAWVLVLLQSCTSTAQFVPRKCLPRSEAANVPQITSWLDLKHLIETSTSDVVLPSFQIAKAAYEPPILLNSLISVSCVAGGACILTSSDGNGGGTFIEIRGKQADVRIQGLTFRNASTSAIVVAKHAGANVDGEQMICDSNFIG